MILYLLFIQRVQIDSAVNRVVVGSSPTRGV